MKNLLFTLLDSENTNMATIRVDPKKNILIGVLNGLKTAAEIHFDAEVTVLTPFSLEQLMARGETQAKVTVEDYEEIITVQTTHLI